MTELDFYGYIFIRELKRGGSRLAPSSFHKDSFALQQQVPADIGSLFAEYRL